MVDSELNKRYCQSCGMPLRFDVKEYLGTNLDCSPSDDFCYYCLKDGKYIVDISMSEMIDIWVKYTDKYNEYSGTSYSSQELKTILSKRLPALSRWKQKQETYAVHKQAIQNIIIHINNHLFDSLDMDELILMSRLSKFHFRRVFKTITGENIASYIQRLRIEQIAHLLISTDFKLEQIIKQTSYQTKFSFGKAFRKHFDISPSEYRKRYKLETTDRLSGISYEIKPIQQMAAFCVEVGDAYKNKHQYRSKWNRLLQHAKQNNLTEKFLSISLDDPLITPTEKCRFYLGVVVPKETKRELRSGVIQIPDGRYAVFRHTGSYASLHKFYRLIYEEWFPKNRYRPKSTLSFEVYLNNPRTTKFSGLITEIYIPIEKI